MAVDLAAQFGTDRAAGSGDQDPFTGEIARNRGDVGLDLATPQQIGEVEVADVAHVHAPVDEIHHPREHLDGEARVLGDLGDLP